MNQAKALHSGIEFSVLDIKKENLNLKDFGQYDLIYVKDLLWYILPELRVVFSNLKALLEENGLVYINQSIPGLSNFYGKDVFSDPMAVINYCAEFFEIQYASSTQEKSILRANGTYDTDLCTVFG